MNWFKSKQDIHKVIPLIVDKMKIVLQERISTLILFGSVVKGNWNPEYSDINLICEFKNRQLDVLDRAGSLKKDFQKYRVNCLWFSEGAVAKATDVFPIEMLDLKLHHQILIGEDIFPSLVIHKKDLRLACERIAREKLLMLRRNYILMAGHEQEIRNLLLKSSPTWGAEFQAILYIAGQEIPNDLKQRAQKVGELLSINSAPFEALFEWRKTPKIGNAVFLMHLLREYLDGVKELVDHIDKLEVK